MNNHQNARVTFDGRLLLVRRVLDEGLRPTEVAQAMGVSLRTVYKWLRRYHEEGKTGLLNRLSTPRRSPRVTSEEVCDQIIARWRQRQTFRHIANAIRVGHSTVARLLKKQGLNRLSALEPAKPDNRYEHGAPGDLLHLDIKKLGRFQRPGHRVTGDRRQQGSRGACWEYVHIAIDDHSRIAFGSIHPDETGKSACHALLKAVRYYAQLGIWFSRVLTDNGACYKSRRFARLCKRLGLQRKQTRPYTPRTNGKVERFIHLIRWLHQYNWHRPHASLDYLPPITRAGLSVNNLRGLHN